MHNLILDTDSYKASHFLQYPPGTRHVSSYIESRGGDFGHTLFFGLQMFLDEYLSQPVTHADIDEAEAVLRAHGLPFNRDGWAHIVDHHGGRLPVEIQAVAEGSVLPVRQVLVQVVNTDPAVPWLTSYLETALLRAVWYPTTVATLSWQIKRRICACLKATADNLDGLAFKLHDFGARGASSAESAAIGGSAHLVNFMGTDTVAALTKTRRHYDADMAGYSIPAAEHSTITAWGRDEEARAYANMLARFAGEGKLVAVVSDSWDLWHALDHIWGGELKQAVERNGGTVVIRPDSGDPVEVVVATVERLMARFGYRTNSKGYRLLPDCIRVIQGDGVNLQSIDAILSAMQARGLSADNIAFGMGGALLQKMDRDSLRFAMKASAVEVNGQWRDVFKAPVTDPGKHSRAGRLALVQDAEGQYQTVRSEQLAGRHNLLQTVYRNGQLCKRWRFDEIRQRAAQVLETMAD